MSIKSLIHNALQKYGYDFQRYYPPSKEIYEPFHPYRYSPWNEDPEFLHTYKKVTPYTLVDRSRCYELWSLVKQCKKISGSLIEIGVWKGGTGALIAKSAQINGIDEPVYLCDTFTGVVKANEEDSTYRGGEHYDASKQDVEKILFDLSLTNAKILEGIFPEETGHLVSKEKFRFCHIDVDVYQSAKDIMDWLWNKMVIGGIVVFDDYGFRGTDGITKYVNEQLDAPDRFVVYNLNGHGLFIKIIK